jgi:pimeloyl-ACP methyl ester carboxylesterase
MPLYRRMLIALAYVVHHVGKVTNIFWPTMRKILFWHPFGAMMPASKSKHPYLWRFVGGVLYRVALLPLVVMGAWLVMIYSVTHPPRQAIAVTPDQFSLVCRDVRFNSDDGVIIKGWYINSLVAGGPLTTENWKQRRPGVVLCHGYGGNRDQLLYPLGRELAQAGYDLLLLDFRGHGLSADAPVSFGTTEAADVMAAVRYLQSQSGVDEQRIGILGTGMGGYAAILAGPRCKGVRCVVAVDSYPSVPAVFENMAHRMHVPTELGTAFSWGMSAYFGHRLIDENAVDSSHNYTDRGLLLITGSRAESTPPADLEPIVAGAGGNIARLIVPGARDGQAANSPAVARMVVSYFDGMLIEQESHAKVVAKMPPHL